MRASRVKGIKKLIGRASDLHRTGRMFLFPGRVGKSGDAWSPVDPSLFLLGGSLEIRPRQARAWVNGLLREFEKEKGITLRDILGFESVLKGEAVEGGVVVQANEKRGGVDGQAAKKRRRRRARRDAVVSGSRKGGGDDGVPEAAPGGEGEGSVLSGGVGGDPRGGYPSGD